MSNPHNWTQAELDTVKTMRADGKSFQAIADHLGTVGRDTVRKKFAEIEDEKAGKEPQKPSGRRAWSEKDIQTLKDGYAAGDDIETIMGNLEDDRSKDTVYVKASSLGITRPRGGSREKTQNKSASSASVTEGENISPVIPSDHAWELRIAGLTPYEAAIVDKVPAEAMKAAFRDIGWEEQRIAPNSRVAMRSKIMAMAAQITGEELDRSQPTHLMVLLSLCADHSQRDLAETARLSLLPLPWVERVFGRLDAEGVWPVTDRSSGDLQASDYERFAEICEQEMFMLMKMPFAAKLQAA